MSKKKSSRRRDNVPSGVKMIAVYGHYSTEVNVLERVWKTRKDGIKQRYWVQSGRTEIQSFSGRFEFHGTGRNLARAVMMTDHLVPRPRKRFQVVSAKEFLSKPYKFARQGYWVMREVES